MTKNVNNNEISCIKTSINPILWPGIKIFPYLYTKKALDKIKSQIQYKKLQLPTIAKVQENFYSLLNEFKSIPQQSTKNNNKSWTKIVMTPNIPPSYVLIPKYYKPTRRSNNHPMLFRQRLCPRSQNLQSYKTRAVQHLVAQNIINKLFYIFDESEKK